MKNPKEHILALLQEAYELRGSNLPKGRRLAEEALAQSETSKNPELIALSLNKLALFCMIIGDYDNALSMSEKAIHNFKKLDNKRGIADAKYNLAGLYYRTDNYHLGMVNLIDCLKIYKAFEDYHGQSKTYKTLGTIYELLGDEYNAITSYKRAITTGKKAKNKSLVSNAYNPLSGIYLKGGKVAKAIDIIEKSIVMKKETNDTRGLAFAIYGRGKIYLHQHRLKEAKKDFKDALKIHREVGENFGIGMTYNKQGLLYIKEGAIEKAKETFHKALDIATSGNMHLIYLKSSNHLYELYKLIGDQKNALKYLELNAVKRTNSENTQTRRVVENYQVISRLDALEKEKALAAEKELLEREQQRVEQSSQMKQEFLSAMSHEIRTPLNAVTSIISLLEERSTENDKKLLTALRFSSKNLLRIINDILDFSKLDSNNMSLDLRATNFKELIKNSLDTYHTMASEKGVQLSVQLGKKLSPAYILDETKLFQILGNLVSNAIKYTNEGSVFVKISVLKKKKKSDSIRFEIVDTGIGISEKDSQRLFESFYMPTSITTRSQGGTGLGLAIVKKLVELYGGKIALQSKEKYGSTFSFNLELERAQFENLKNTIPLEKLENKVAILAEDNEINALVMGQLLQKWGIRIIRVKNGKEAVDVAGQEKVDYILMDIHMPEMNGYEATTIIRSSDNPNRNTPIFAFTADVTAKSHSGFDKLFNGILIKPIQINHMLEALTQSFDHPIPSK